VSFQITVSQQLAEMGSFGNGLGAAPLTGTPCNPFRPVRFKGFAYKLAATIRADSDVLVGEPLDSMATT
jgi:hypothetical protein